MEFGAKTMLKIKKRAEKASTPNPFAGKKDIYLTTNKIAVTTTTNTTAKRGHTKVTKTKYATCAHLKPRRATPCALAERELITKRYERNRKTADNQSRNNAFR